MKCLSTITLSFVLALTSMSVANAGMSDADIQTKCEKVDRVKSGDMVGIGRSVGFIVGARWGVGAVKMNDGSTFKFKARGLKLTEIGASEVYFRGTVYNLADPKQMEGIFVGLAGGATIANQGAGFATYANGDCVIVELTREKAMGVQGSIPNLGSIQVQLAD